MVLGNAQCANREKTNDADRYGSQLRGINWLASRKSHVGFPCDASSAASVVGLSGPRFVALVVRSRASADDESNIGGGGWLSRMSRLRLLGFTADGIGRLRRQCGRIDRGRNRHDGFFQLCGCQYFENTNWALWVAVPRQDVRSSLSTALISATGANRRRPAGIATRASSERGPQTILIERAWGVTWLLKISAVAWCSKLIAEIRECRLEQGA